MQIRLLKFHEDTNVCELDVDEEGKQYLLERGFNAMLIEALKNLERPMNENRQKAFNEWWLIKAPPENRMTPSAIWDAACDWMKEEMRWKMERMFDKPETNNE